MQGDLIDSNVLFKSVIYSDEPSNIEMLRRENYVYVPSKAGGPIWYYPDPNKSSQNKIKPSLFVSDGKGNFLSEIEILNLEVNDVIFKAGWTDDYRILVVTRNKFIHLYTTDGTLVFIDDNYSRAKFNQGSPLLHNVYFYDIGLVMVLGIEVTDPNTNRKIRRSFIVTAIVNLRSNKMEFARKMFMPVSELILYYNRFANILIALILDENGMIFGCENLFFYFKFPTLTLQRPIFSPQSKSKNISSKIKNAEVFFDIQL